MDDLPACPYCRSRDVRLGVAVIGASFGPDRWPPPPTPNRYYVWCGLCETDGPMTASRAEARAAWHRFCRGELDGA